MDARNTVDAPNDVKPAVLNATREDGALVLRLPPKSVSVVRLQ
jgi:alpha-L-arabinofuranosidase